MTLLAILGPTFICTTLTLLVGLTVYHVSKPTSRAKGNPLRSLAGPPVRTLFGNHMSFVLEYVLALYWLTLYLSSLHSPSRSPKIHALYVQKYGRNVRIRGLGPVGAIELSSEFSSSHYITVGRTSPSSRSCLHVARAQEQYRLREALAVTSAYFRSYWLWYACCRGACSQASTPSCYARVFHPELESPRPSCVPQRLRASG